MPVALSYPAHGTAPYRPASPPSPVQMLFMKGTAHGGAQCGFSSEALRVIEANGVDVKSALAIKGADGKPLLGR